MKKIFTTICLIFIVFSILFTFFACNNDGKSEPIPSITSIKLGQDYVDLKADIRVLTFRTDIMDKFKSYADTFKKLYPHINITYNGITDYENTVISYLSSNIKWGDIMMIPLGIEKDVAACYFEPLGNETDLSECYNFTSAWTYDNLVYGIASTGNANGVIYNKRVFRDAGINNLPTTPEEFIAALKLIKQNTSAIPLYTNYADEWPMSCWDSYIGVSATGSNTYMYHDMTNTDSPFVQNDTEIGPYYVYKLLYDAVANGLTEEDYTTTSEAQCYEMINNGKIGCMMFASWAVVQAMNAGPNSEDIGYMPFPMTINGKRFVSINGDYSYGINASSSYNSKLASLLFIKFLVEQSGFSYSEGGLSIVKGKENPDYYSFLDDCIVLEENELYPGEIITFERINSESGLLFNANGNSKGQSIVEHAFLNDKTFSEIMDIWNQKWKNARKRIGL